jgi:hypothetical protein
MGGRMKDTPLRYCKYCGQKLERKRFLSGRLEDLSAFCRHKYCDKHCMRKDWLKTENCNQTYRNAHTTAQKANELILQKDKCEICGKDGRLDVHHIDGNHQNNELNNLIVLCRSCHMKQHRKKGLCIICGEPVKGYGYCNKHYLRYKKYGDPMYVSPHSKVDSKGEEKISELLKENNIPFVYNKSVFKDCLLFTGGIARFDFYVDGQYIIEYDGEQHYKYSKSGWYTIDEYEVTKQRDLEKTNYCLQNNIPIIRIPYWIYDDLTIEDLILETTEYLVDYNS